MSNEVICDYRLYSANLFPVIHDITRLMKVPRPSLLFCTTSDEKLGERLGIRLIDACLEACLKDSYLQVHMKLL